LDPGGAHASGDTLLTSPASPVKYTDDVTHDFWFADQTGGMGSDGVGSEYVVFNEPLKQTAAFSLQSPVAQCLSTPPTTPACNPPFTLGATVRFAFNLTIGGASVSNAVARLSISQVEVAPDGTIQILQTVPVICKNSVDNFFKIGNNLYTCPWDSSVAALSAGGPGPGLYLATMFSDSFPVESPGSPSNQGQTLFFTLQ
jgi:hypothetical protein